MLRWFWVCHWKRTVWVVGWDGIVGLWEEGGSSVPVYWLFGVIYWSRQPVVFQPLTSLLFRMASVTFFLYLTHMMTYIYIYIHIYIAEAYHQITNPCIVEHAIICTDIDITPGGKKPLSARMMTCVYYRDTWLNTSFLAMLTICFDCERSWQGTQLVTSECLQHGPLIR